MPTISGGGVVHGEVLHPVHLALVLVASQLLQLLTAGANAIRRCSTRLRFAEAPEPPAVTSCPASRIGACSTTGPTGGLRQTRCAPYSCWTAAWGAVMGANGASEKFVLFEGTHDRMSLD